MSTPLETFLVKYNACVEGRVYCKKTGAKSVDEIWERKDLPHAWRLWVFSKFVPQQKLFDFILWVSEGRDLSYSERAIKALSMLKSGGGSDLCRAYVEALWIPKEVARLTWVNAYKTVEQNPDYLELIRKKCSKTEATLQVCHASTEAEITRQAKRMFEILPEINN